jgi:hypothetical protein
LLQRPLQEPQQQQQAPQQQLQQQQQQQPDEEGQGSAMAISPEADASVPAAEARAGQAAQQQQAQQQQLAQEEQQQDEQQQASQQELVGDALDAAGNAAAEAAPNTPVHLKQATSDNTSCSGTPNTPAEQRNGLHRGAGTSPSDYVTPQHRLRMSRPLAPLHKDCLIAAATRVAGLAGSSQDAAAAATPAAAGRGSTQHAARAPDSADEVTKAAAGSGAVAVAPAAGSAAGGSTGQQTGSSDSSKGDDRFMDSPLQPCQQLQSPTSEWHQGMVAMLRNLQQTPLQLHAAGADGAAAAAAGCDSSTAAGEAGGKACEAAGAVRAGSRALRRLQDELERGSGIAAAAQQQLGCSKADMQMPFSSALVTPPTAGISAAACSAPMLLPLFNGGSSAQPQMQPAATPAAAAARGGSVASVSLTPAVMSCSRGEQQVFAMPVSAGMTPLAPAGLPAVAWPVQQRPDGGLIVTAPPGSDVPAAAVLQLTPPVGAGGSSSRLGSSGNKENAAAALQCSVPSFTGDAMAALLQQHQQSALAGAVDGTPVVGSMLNGSMQWAGPNGRVTVVSLQPVTMLASMMGAAASAAPAAAAAAAAGLAAMQPMLSLQPQPSKPCSSSAAVAEQRKPAAASAQPERYESSHAATVRSRLHALIDGV